jgi:hypothetical protein
MPVVLRERGFTFRFYSQDFMEPPHVHVSAGEGIAKVWVESSRIEYHHGFSKPELNRIRKIIAAHRQQILEQWRDFFDL